MIGVIGINHTTAPTHIREQFAIADSVIHDFAIYLEKQAQFSSIVVLSTCNRTEIYFSQHIHNSKYAIILVYNSLMAYKTIDFDAETYFYTYTQDKAVEHLFSVTSGIDSMLIGEDQIIGQVKHAYEICASYALPDAVLQRLFQKSLEAGKRVRTETNIKMGCTSLSYISVEKCQSVFSTISDKSVLVIGTGETSKLTLQALYKKGVRSFYISNRTKEHAEPIIATYNAHFVPLTNISSTIADVDIVIAATSSPSFIVSYEMIHNLHTKHQRIPLLIDLSVPRNIDPAINNIPETTVISVDDLQEIIHANKHKREECIDAGYEIIEELVVDFMSWFSFRALQPAIRAINFHLEKIYATEYIASEHSNPQEIDAFSKKLIKKYKKELITNLKHITDNGRKELYLQVINDLFKPQKSKIKKN
ncbi:MAG: glutamyl-tRNA reductase [Bacteroidales bacterium]